MDADEFTGNIDIPCPIDSYHDAIEVFVCCINVIH